MGNPEKRLGISGLDRSDQNRRRRDRKLRNFTTGTRAYRQLYINSSKMSSSDVSDGGASISEDEDGAVVPFGQSAHRFEQEYDDGELQRLKVSIKLPKVSCFIGVPRALYNRSGLFELGISKRLNYTVN